MIKIPEKIQKIIDELLDQYEFADSTSVLGLLFSGGKDSTVLLTRLVKLKKLKQTIPNYV